MPSSLAGYAPSTRDLPGFMLRSVVSAVAANMMLVQYGADVPISLARSTGVGDSPDHGINRNRVPVGISKACLAQASFNGSFRPRERRLGRHGGRRNVGLEHRAVTPHPVQNRSYPIRRASATTARFVPLRFATCAAQLLSHDDRPRFIMTVAAWQSALRRFASPAREN